MQRSSIVVIGKQAAPSDFGSPNNLPVAPTPLIGRAHEVERVCELLQRGDVRLLTLIGPGGVGKTRLALEVALALGPNFPDGVYFVPLASVVDPERVVAAIAQTLEVKETDDKALLATLQAYVRQKQLAIVLDNFEQVIPAAGVVAALLAAGPGLKLLVTSREVLHIRGEQEFPVLPLALPSPDHAPRVATLTNNPAVMLFVQRAAAVQPDFALNPANARIVAEICARLDGLPLAIELAAARTKLLSLPALLARLADRLRLLTGGAHDLPLRQQTLRNTLDWSYDLLNAEERRLFRCLGVFVGGSSLAAVAWVVEGITVPLSEFPVDGAAVPTAVLEGLSSLLDKSLLRQTAAAGGEMRFWMLETVRSYAGEQLEQSDEAGEVYRRHASFCLAFVEAAEPALSGPEQGHWLTRLEGEHDNVRAALHWSLHSDGAATALRMARVLWRFWDIHGHLSEGRRWMEDALSMGSAQPDALRADVLHGLSRLTWLQGDYIKTRQWVEESLTLWRQIGSVEGIARELHILGIIMGPLHQPEQAQAYYEESLALWRDIGHKGNIARLLNSVGTAARARGAYTQAQSVLTESLALHRELGNGRGISTALANLGFVAHGLGDDTGALVLFADSLRLRRELGYRTGIVDCLVGFAGAFAGLGQEDRAARLFSAVAALCEVLGYSLDPEDQAVYNHDVVIVRSQLDDTAFTQAWQDGQDLTLEQAVEEALAPLLTVEAASAARPAPARILDEPTFSAAVQEALRTFTQPGQLQRNPLVQSRHIVTRAGLHATVSQRVTALQTSIQEACEVFQQVPRDAKFYRVLQHTYLHPRGTQEQIAEFLDLPFSTFRRHLKEGVRRVTETLWVQELEL